MPESDILFQPLSLGNITLRNRMVMAPCTRQRAHLDGTPTDLMREYYRQRASAGLIITEGISPSAGGNGYLFAPGLYNDAHEAAWAGITEGVHSEGGRIFAQIMHVGRLSDPLILPPGKVPVSASRVRPDPIARHYTVNCPRPKRNYGTPHALSIVEVAEVIEEYANSARRARIAGFDGVELHAASGYLPMQFLSTNTNQRTDRYGGSITNRIRFVIECVEAMQSATGPGFIAVKVGPGWTFHDVFDDDPIATYSELAREVSRLSIAYLQVGNYGQPWDVLGTLRPWFKGPMIGVGGFTRCRAIEALAAKRVEAIAFGQAYIANPDLAERFREGLPINQPDSSTFYTQGAEGYVDYPMFHQAAPASLLPVDSAFATGSSRSGETGKLQPVIPS